MENDAQPTSVIDRFWFKSVYSREPGGVLFELATDGLGFGVDEDPATLGESLVLPPWLETNRAAIECACQRLTTPNELPDDGPAIQILPLGQGRADLSSH